MVQGESPGQQLGVVTPAFCGPVLTNTAACKEACFLDSATYFMKKNIPSSVSPHCEWFCATLARAVGIDVPNFAVVKSTTDHGLWFGSEQIKGEIHDWWPQLQAGKINIGDVSAAMSRIYAFDLFVMNGDRNTGNHLVIKEGEHHSMFAFDHGEAWIFGGFPIKGTLPATTATIQNKVEFQKYFPDYIDTVEMEDVLNKISSITRGRIKDIIEAHPNEWLKSAKKSEIVTWWATGKARRRCDLILKGIQDGTLV